MKLLVLGVVSIFLITALSKQILISYSSETQSIDLFKYFHSLSNEFFVDIGAYDAIYASNTIYLSGWSGLNVEANQKRLKNLIISRPHHININMAVTKQTGGYATLIEYQDDAVASIDLEFIRLHEMNPTVSAVQEKVPQITMADLCHLYYPKRPKLMTLDIEGHGLIALTSNDWTDQKCLPEVICAERILQKNQDRKQQALLQSKNYVIQDQTFLNQIYIHRDFVDIYKQRKLQGEKLLDNMEVLWWLPIFQQIFKLVNPNTNMDFKTFRHVDPVNAPVHIHFTSQKIISLEKLRERSFFISNKNRPILIMHYNPLKSKLYFGSSDYKITKITLLPSKLNLHKIQINYPNEKTEVYVFDHNVEAPRPLQILDARLEQAVSAKCKLNGN